MTLMCAAQIRQKLHSNRSIVRSLNLNGIWHQGPGKTSLDEPGLIFFVISLQMLHSLAANSMVYETFFSISMKTYAFDLLFVFKKYFTTNLPGE